MSDELVGFVWPGAVRTISVEGDSSTCKLICNIYLDSHTKGKSTNTTYEIQPEIAFTGLGLGQYTISAKCRESATAYCIIGPQYIFSLFFSSTKKSLFRICLFVGF
jgi:hypothetical protein